MAFRQILYELTDDHVATVTLNRPEQVNAFDQDTCEDFRDLWNLVREDDGVHAIVLRGAGDRGFCGGVDRKRGYDRKTNVWNEDTPVTWLLPKFNRVFKPLITAVHGVAVGGALYWISESDIVICADDAIMCDPHVSLGLTSARAPVTLARKIPFGESVRMALMGTDEWLSAQRALEIGLASEVVPREKLFERAHEIAATIAAKPPAAVQGTLRSMWEALDIPLSQAWRNAANFPLIGNPVGAVQLAAQPAGGRMRGQRTIR